VANDALITLVRNFMKANYPLRGKSLQASLLWLATSGWLGPLSFGKPVTAAADARS